jgi:GNAT superfamily N-acetyltransferase
VKTQIRPIEESRLSEAFDVIRGLRGHLDKDEFLARLKRQRAIGFYLVGAFDGEVLVGVMGLRPVETLARGKYLHVDDLVVTKGERGRGAGRALLAYAEELALKEGRSAIFLDSRPEVITFYQHLGYELHSSPSMFKRFHE